MTLTKRGHFAAGVLIGALTVGLLWWGQATTDYCQNERHPKSIRCILAQP